ncbi:metallophosphoesterase family protein [Opitutales bacterium]|nr:metallophosphoesterase family protein [Opitutales bacterium]
MKFLVPFLFFLFLIQFSQARRGIEEALFTWTDSPSTTLNVIWLVEEDEPTDFKWGKQGGEINRNAVIKRQSFYEKTLSFWGLALDVKNGRFSLPSLKNADVEVCQVQLTGLAPDTVYCVKLGKKEFKARTLPAKRPDRISFVTGGDMMHKPEWHEDGVKAMASRSPDFALIGGDLAYANGQDWKRWLDWIEIYADHARSSDGLSIPFVVAIGNHEVIGGYGQIPEKAPLFFNLFPFPQANDATYIIDMYEDLSVLVLNSNHTRPVDDQVEFIEQALSLRKTRKHLFALYHFPAYGIVKGGLGNDLSKSIRQHWTPLFDQYGLDAAFENDHHVYKRSKLIKGGKVHDSGTLYIGDGAWGVKTRGIGSEDLWYVEQASPTRHVIEVVIENNVRSYRAINHDQKVFDEFVDNRDAQTLSK